MPDGVAAVRMRRRVGRIAVEVDRERAAILDQRAAEVAAPVPALRRALFLHQWILAVHRAVVETQPRRRAQRPDARLRDDVDVQPAGAVVLGRELIAGDADHLDLRLRRQLLSLEAVDADGGSDARHVLELPLQLVGIFGQRLDLLARERGAERQRAIGRGLLPIASDGDGVLHLSQRQDQDVFVVAGADPHVADQPEIESGELALNRVPARPELVERREANVRRLDRRRPSRPSSRSRARPP